QWKNFAKTRQRASHLWQVQKSYLLGLPNISLSGLSAGLRSEKRSWSPAKDFARSRVPRLKPNVSVDLVSWSQTLMTRGRLPVILAANR
ncbi:MAG: hypothetical protein ACM3N3_19935, partial [Betaproteobacteria bacterium]